MRIEHEGFSSLRLERAGRTFRFDPCEPPADRDVSLLTWNEHERLDACARAIRQGGRPTVVAPRTVLDWLGRSGAFEGREAPCSLDGVRVRAMSYEPIPFAGGLEVARKAGSVLLNPARAASRIRARAGLPRSQPVAVELTLPDGGRLVHLNLALHRGTPPDWLERALRDLVGATWLLCGVDFGEDAAVVRYLPRFEAEHVLVADLVGDVRRLLGLPTTALTPIVDRLNEAGVPAHVLATRTRQRFE